MIVMKNSVFYSIAGSLLLASFANAQNTVVYSEDFDPEPDHLIDFNAQIGGDPDLRPNNTKIVELGQWAVTANATFDDIGGDNGIVLRPQLEGKNNGRAAGVILNPSLFSATGAGTYTLVFDVIPSSSEGGNRVYVGAGTGYDLSGDTNAKLNLALSTPGFKVRKNDGAILWSALSGENGATTTHLVTTEDEWVDGDGNSTGVFVETPGVVIDILTAATVSVDFEYDGTSAIAIAFAGYNTDYGVDNIRIETKDSGGNDDMWGGFAIDEEGYVDTGDWMGLLYVAEAPWVWVADQTKWWYVPEPPAGANGAWAYVLP